MAQRPVYLPGATPSTPVRTVMVDFTWYAGMAVSQKQKSIAALHEAASSQTGANRILEISSKSVLPLGVAASAFNLMITTPRQRSFSVESAFQASKVFEAGGPYTDLLDTPSRQAKKDPRLQQSGRLTAFRFFGTDWPLQPATAFYDWLYINAVLQNPELASGLLEYEGFTDIEFNPEKSINCQACSAALYVFLARGGLLQEVRRPEQFLAWLATCTQQNAHRDDLQQPQLF